MNGREGDVASGGARAVSRVRSDVSTIPWIDALPPDPTAVLGHLYREMGRLGLGPDDLSPAQRSVLHDVERWIDRGLVDAVTRILAQTPLIASAERRPERPPLRVRAVITRRGALSVNWEPVARLRAGGSQDRSLDRRAHLRLVGSETASPPPLNERPRSAKACNGVLLLRSVRGLGDPLQSAKAKGCLDPISILLIFLVRRSYEILIERLRACMPIEAVDQFVFAFDRTALMPFQQLRSWKIVEAQGRTGDLVALEGARGRARR